MASASRESQEHGQAYGSRKVKITILASEWGSNKGDLSKVSRELAIQLAKSSSVEITFFVPKCSEVEKEAAFAHNVHVLEAKRRPGYEELEWLSFPPEQLQVDIIVGHGVKLGRQAQIIRESHQCKWVQVVHTDPEEQGMFKSYPNPISTGEEKHSVEVELCKLADFVVGVGPKVTEAFRSYLRGYRRDESIFELTPGVFDEFTSVEQVPEERKHRSVLVFGRGNTDDFELLGFDIVGRAVASLPDTQLVFVGAPDGNLEEVAKRFLDCRVPANHLKIRSYDKTRESLKRLFCEVDLVLLASRTEGFGVTGLEALSAGLPVMASKNSGFGEALNKVPFGSSFVIDSDDPQIWAAAIKKIWEKDRKTRLREAESLRASYENEYSWIKQRDALLFKMIHLVRAFLRVKIDCEAMKGPGAQEKATGMGEKPHESRSLHLVLDGAGVLSNTPNQPEEVYLWSGVRKRSIPSANELLRKIADKYFEELNPSKPEEFNGYLQYLKEIRKVLFVEIETGSLILTVEIRSVKILEELWQDYRTGHLNDMAQKFLVTEDILREFDLIEVRLATTIANDEYRACRNFLKRPDLIRVRLDCETITGRGIQGGVTGTVVTSPRPEEVVQSSTASNTLNQQQGVDMTALKGQKGGSGCMLSGTQVLQSIEHKYFQTADSANQEERNAFLKYLTGVGKVLFPVAEEGGLIVTLECRSLLLVDQLWEDYFTGRLNEIAQKFLVTEDILKPLGLVNVKLVTQIVEEEYRECRRYFWNRSRVPTRSVMMSTAHTEGDYHKSIVRMAMEIFIKPLSGRKIVLTVLPSDTVWTVKRKREAVGGLPLRKKLTFAFDGRQLDDDATLAQCSIQSGSTLCEVDIDEIDEPLRHVLHFLFCFSLKLCGALAALLSKQPELVERATRSALEAPGIQLQSISVGSVLVTLECSSRQRFLMFLLEFAKQEAQERLKEELRSIGFKEELNASITNRGEVEETFDEIRSSFYTTEKENELVEACAVYLPQEKTKVNVDMPTGKKITLELKSSDTIKMVKDQIEATEGIPSHKQILELDGERLENSRRLSFYNIQQKSTVQLSERDMEILVTIITDQNIRTVTLSVDPNDTIRIVKVKIQENTGIKPELQRLYFSDELEDDRTLRQYKIQNRSVLLLAVKASR